MTHHLNTNRQFMIGNGILAFAVIFVVVLFVYMSLQLNQKQKSQRRFIETYTLTLTDGFVGDSITFYINDSLIHQQTIRQQPYSKEINRFSEHNALMIVDNRTDRVFTFDLSDQGGTYRFIKEKDEIKQVEPAL